MIVLACCGTLHTGAGDVKEGSVPALAGSHFPVSRSRLSVDALARVLGEAYALAEVRCQLIKATINDVYQVTSAGGMYILRVYRAAERSVTAITSELDLLDFLTDRGLVVGPAVRQTNGERLLPVHAPEGLRFAVLFTFVAGEQFSKTPSLDTVARYGQVVARLHSITDEAPQPRDRPRYDFESLVARPIAAIAQVIDRPEVLDYLQAVGARLQPIIEGLPRAAPGYGLIHGDLIPSNALVSADSSIVLIDFDFYGLGWRALDLASYLNETAYWKMPSRVAETFLEEYQRTRRLSDWELEALPGLEAARNIASLGTPARHVNDWGRSYLSDHMVGTMLDGIKRSMHRLG